MSINKEIPPKTLTLVGAIISGLIAVFLIVAGVAERNSDNNGGEDFNKLFSDLILMAAASVILCSIILFVSFMKQRTKARIK